MKKLLIITALALLLPAAGLCWTVTDAMRAVVAAKNEGGVESPCPSGTSYQSAWDGDFTDDTDKLCYNSKNSQKDGSVVGTVALGTDYGESGSVGILLNQTVPDQRIEWPVSSDDIITSGVGTVCIRMYINAASVTGERAFFETHASSYRIGCKIRGDSSDTIRCDHYGGTNQALIDTLVSAPLQEWFTFRYSWDDTNDNHETCINASCNEDTGDTLDDLSLDTFIIGEERIGASSMAESVYVTSFKIYSTYKATCE